MDIYEGLVFDVRMAVWPTEEGVSYHILHRDRKGGREAYLKCGFGRELKVNEHAKLILEKGNKRKVLNLQYVMEDQRLVCDLPEFLKKNGIRFKLCNYPERNCYRVWDAISHCEYICKNGKLWWGSDWCIYTQEYWLGIYYNACFPVIAGKRVSKIRFFSAAEEAESEETLKWFKQSLAEQVTIDWKGFGQVLDELGLRKESDRFEITLLDGSMIRGNAVDWCK